MGNVFHMRLFFLFFFFLPFGCLSLWFLGPRILLLFVFLLSVPSYFLFCALQNQTVRPLTSLRVNLSLLVGSTWKPLLWPSSLFSYLSTFLFFFFHFPSLDILCF